MSLISFCVSRKKKRRYFCRVMYVLLLYDYINNWYTNHFYATACEEALKKIRVQNKSGSKLLGKIWRFPCKGIFAVLLNRLYKKFKNIPGTPCHLPNEYIERSQKQNYDGLIHRNRQWNNPQIMSKNSQQTYILS